MPGLFRVRVRSEMNAAPIFSARQALPFDFHAGAGIATILEWGKHPIAAESARVYFRAMKEDKMLRAARPTRVEVPCQTNPPPRILVVDDELDIRRLNAEVLMESGYHVDAAENGAVAWMALNAKRYDRLITDDKMPTVTGLELILKLRSEEMMLPVILVSGKLPTEEIDLHPWLRIQATLLKPYTIAELLVTVEKVLHSAADGVREQLAPPANWQSQPSAPRLRPG